MDDKTSLVKAKEFARERLIKYLRVEPDEVEPLSLSHPQDSTDLIYDGKKYTVKSSNPVSISKRKKPLVWDFDLRGNVWKDGRNNKVINSEVTCDYYLLVGMVDNEPEKLFLVSAHIVPSSHIRINVTGESKYYQYAI